MPRKKEGVLGAAKATPDANQFASLILIGACTLTGMQVIRALFPLVIFTNALTEWATKPRTVALTLLIMLSAPLLAPLLSIVLRPRQLFKLSVIGMAGLRLALQISPSANVNLVLTAASLIFLLHSCVSGVTLFAAAPRACYRLTLGVLTGLSVDAALNSALLSWDFVWRRDWLSLLLALLISGSIVYCCFRLKSQEADSPAVHLHWRQFVVFGAFFALQVLYLQNVGMIAAITGFSLPGAGVLVLAGDVLALMAVSWVFSRSLSRRASGILSLSLVALLAILPNSSGLAAAAIALSAQPLLSALLAASLMRVLATKAPTLTQSSRQVGIAMFVFMGIILLQYASYQIVLPYGGTIAPLAAGLLILAALTRTQPRAALDRVNWRYAAVPLALVIVPLGWLPRWPEFPTAVPPTQSLRLVNYNIHQGVDTDGWVNPEAIAAVIEAQHPDVVVLEEVIRGQVIAGGLDSAEWLSQRLNMRYYFVHAPDATFGNAIFTRLPVLSWEHGTLPRGTAPQQRRYILARLDMGLGDSQPLTIIGTHLHHVESEGHLRVPQVERLIQAWDNQPHTLIVGDLNARPDAPEMALLAESSLVDAQVVTGHEDLFTNNSVEPFQRIDYIWGTPDLIFTEFIIPPTTASDHLPLAVTVSYEP